MSRRGFLDQFKAARRVGTPLIAVQTPDPAATVASLRPVVNGHPLVVWDICRGWTAGNTAAEDAITEALQGNDPASATSNPVESLLMAAKLPEKSVLVVFQAQRWLDNMAQGASFVQAAWNLRDPFKVTGRTLVLISPQFTLPAELANDVLLLDEPLPTAEDLAGIVTEVADSAEVKLTDKVQRRAVDLLRGLAAFPAEQTLAMSFTRDGLDLDALGERKRKMIANTPGLSVWEGAETLDAVGGNANVKEYVKRIVKGKDSPLCVVFIDEIEKALAGATFGDTSGVSQGQLQVLLTYMEDNRSSGMIFLGPPGAGKSAVAKAIGGEAGVPTIAMDLNGMKNALVGSSEERMRNAMKVISAVGGDRVLFVATCNKISTLPPELRRRFTMGTFFFDLPDAEEREAIWKIYQKVFNLTGQELPNAESWTGAEIKQACLLAYRLNIPLKDTPQYIVPVARAAAEELAVLRGQAHNRYLSASQLGLYSQRRAAPEQPSGRKMEKA